jgi:long-chain acyl-CoA synthetase
LLPINERRLVMWLGGKVAATRFERHFDNRIVRCFNARPPDLHSLLTSAISRNPDGEAIVCGDFRLSYRDLEAHVSHVAAGLRSHGIGRGDRVALIGPVSGG